MVAREDDNQAAVLDEALTRFVNAYVQGEEPDLDEFVQQYPTYEALIRRRIKGLREIDGLFDSLARADESDFDTGAPAHDLVGRKLANFEVEKVIGRGGMGVVYLARDTKLKRRVAIKSLPTGMLANAASQSRFRREAEVLASLDHPGIAVIYDIIEQADGTDYLVLEYVPGDNLSTCIADKTLKPEDVLSIGGQIAEAVCAAHDKGVVHRDLKPGNIRITPEGRVKVLDFGLAKSTGQEVQSNQTTATGGGRLMGTPAYMSPEQVRGKPTDHRTDIWSFGCVMFEMLTSRRPFEGETISDTIALTLEREPDWGALPRQTPENIRILIQRCLNKNPQARLQRIGEAATEIQETLNPAATGSSAGAPLSHAGRLDPVAKARHRRTVAIAVGTLLVAV